MKNVKWYIVIVDGERKITTLSKQNADNIAECYKILGHEVKVLDI